MYVVVVGGKRKKNFGRHEEKPRKKILFGELKTLGAKLFFLFFRQISRLARISFDSNLFFFFSFVAKKSIISLSAFSSFDFHGELLHVIAARDRICLKGSIRHLVFLLRIFHAKIF